MPALFPGVVFAEDGQRAVVPDYSQGPDGLGPVAQIAFGAVDHFDQRLNPVADELQADLVAGSAGGPAEELLEDEEGSDANDSKGETCPKEFLLRTKGHAPFVLPVQGYPLAAAAAPP